MRVDLYGEGEREHVESTLNAGGEADSRGGQSPMVGTGTRMDG